MGLIKLIHKLRNLSVADKQQITKDQLAKMISDLFEQMKLTYANGQKLVYDNPFGLTKEQVLQGLGSDTMELLRLGALLKDCLNVAVPGTIDEDDEYGSDDDDHGKGKGKGKGHGKNK